MVQPLTQIYTLTALLLIDKVIYTFLIVSPVLCAKLTRTISFQLLQGRDSGVMIPVIMDRLLVLHWPILRVLLLTQMAIFTLPIPVEMVPLAMLFEKSIQTALLLPELCIV